MLNESNTIKTIFTMFTLPRGCIGLRKTPREVLWTVLWCLNKHCSTTTLRLGRGTKYSCAVAPRWPHLAFYIRWWTLWEWAMIRSSPREDPPARVHVSSCHPLTFLRSPKRFDPPTSSGPAPGHSGAGNVPWSHFDEFDVEKSVAWRSYSWLWFNFEPVFHSHTARCRLCVCARV